MGYQHLQKLVFTTILTGTGLFTQAQHYFNDLVSVKQLESKQALYRKLHVNAIREVAILPSGDIQSDYQQSSRLSLNADTLWQYRINQQGSVETRLVFDRNGLLTQQSEIQSGIFNSTHYEKSSKGWTTKIESSLLDSMMDFKDHEIHIWQYDEKGAPKQMWRLVEQFDGKMDSTEIRFGLDSLGRVAEERSFKKGKETGFFYYYYNEKGQLTDIVRYHANWKRLLPDQQFEYDEKGILLQKMQLTGSREVTYLIWRYGYDKNGLLNEEALFNNKKEHNGSIRYTYTFDTL